MNKFLIFILLFLLFFELSAQNNEKLNFRVLCYNVENYFDCVDDPDTEDSEYLPTGIRAWNNEKYQRKQINISKVIAAVGGWEGPALVGLCEIESRKCLTDLTKYSGLKNFGYKFLHHESPDIRGVDVALLYQPGKFEPIHDEAIRINFPSSPQTKTRDILFVKGILPTEDTLYVFVCHFPSRLGGELESEERRLYVASVLRSKVDSIFSVNAAPNMLIMGDFNDYPTNNSMLKVLMAHPPEKEISEQKLYNLMFPLHLSGKGSHKHEGEWGALDQIIVSGNLLNPLNKIFALPEDARVFDADFLLENDEKFLGKQPFRTYKGMKYQGGFADHLPVYVDFWY